jgi:hypothetical protein
VVDAFPWGGAPRYFLRDQDRIYGGLFRQRMRNMEMNEVIIVPRSPWQNPYVERVIGSSRRECLDHVIVLGERHLQQLLQQYLHYYHGWRTHLSLTMDCPEPCPIFPPDRGQHHDERQAE